MMKLPRRTTGWLLWGVILLAPLTTASAQFGYGGFGPYGGYGGGYGPYGGYGGFGGVGGFGYAGYGGGYSGFGGSYGGYPLYGSINAYNIGYGNTFGLGLVPPQYVGTGTAGLGPVGVGGINPLFGLGLSPLAIQNAIAEQQLRSTATATPGVGRGVMGNTGIRMNLYPPNTPVTATPARPIDSARTPLIPPAGAR